MKPYDHKEVESKWQKKWEEEKVYRTSEDVSKKKCYVLDMFPYPSGEGLHVGHPKGYIATDVYSRFKKMQGFNVLHPMGWDAFGLPAENYAIKNKVHPRIAVEKNIIRFKEQLKIIGFNYDWDREINTTDPEYYKWTQWIFLKLLEKGLAYESYEPINWCPSCQTGLANEDLDGDRCERCGTIVVKKPMRQWVLRITDYAERLLADIDALNWPESIKESQRNWIGKSQGVNFKCKIKDLGTEIEMYNSVPQTYRAETFTVIAPEHLLVKKLVEGTEYEKPVMEFVEKIKARKAGNKFDIDKDLEGIFTGRYIENYAGTGRDLPIWVASYVVVDYGTGIVNCSAHDVRDFAFATKYNIPLHEVAEPLFERKDGEDAIQKNLPFSERDVVVCILRDPKKDKILTLRWKKNNWQGFVLGGIEKGEDAIESGMREIREETGYKNIRFVQKLGGTIHSRFFQAVKNQNRFAHFTVLSYELVDDSRETVSQEEQDLAEIIWLSPEEVGPCLNRDDMKLSWSRYRGVATPVVKNGILLEPEEFKGREWHEVREDIIDYVVKKGYATRKINYKLRDWIFSRQRYWGEPIPVVHCEKCKVVPVPEKDLPVKLPEVESYAPTGTGESPLADIPEWVNTTCPKCGGKAKRETNTMPQWAGSSWYYLRYIDPHNDTALVDKTKEHYWSPVDLYVGGAEHATRHLIYARFWHKFLYDIGTINYPEPFTRLQHVGLINAEDGRKMSKRYGNVVNPDEIVEKYGADTLRMYEMFLGPFDQAVAWNTEGIIGPRRLLEKVWKNIHRLNTGTSLSKEEKLRSPFQVTLHRTIKKVGEDIENFKFNTAISALMIFANEMEKETQIDIKDYEIVLKLFAPFAPHITDELWSQVGSQIRSQLGKTTSIHLDSWPIYDPTMIHESTVTIVIQVNGKLRATIEEERDKGEEEIVSKAKQHKDIIKKIEGKKFLKTIFVKNKLVNFVVEN